MEIKLPPELESYMMQEIGFKPGEDKRHFVIEAIRQHCTRCEGNRKRADRQRAIRDSSV